MNYGKRFVLLLSFLCGTLHSASADPRTNPRFNMNSVYVKGSFTFDWPDGAGGDLSYGSNALGVSEDGNFIYVSCNAVSAQRGIAKLRIPALGQQAQVVAPCQGPNFTELLKILPSNDGGALMIGGVLEQGGRMVVTGYASYDANNTTRASHWSGTSLTNLTGPWRGKFSSGPLANQTHTGLVKSQMGTIPAEWRPLLGGPAFSTSGYTSIISRQSCGASFSVFDPTVVTGDDFPINILLSCPAWIPGCNTWTSWGPSSNNFEGAELAGGAFIVPGTRTLVVIEREGSGGDCYGYTTNNASLHGQPYPSPEGVRYCYSLSDPMDQKGNKAYPYRLVAKNYDLNELYDVKLGNRTPWSVKQYETINMPGSSPSEFVVSAAFNPSRGELYLIRGAGGGATTVYVYGGFNQATDPAPAAPSNLRSM